MNALDHRFGPTLRMMRESAHKGERDAAEVRLTEFARRAGLTLGQAVALHEKPAPQPAPVSFFAGFDDWMEGREPGYKARNAAAKAERTRQRLVRRDAAIARYGSEEAVLAPCAKELLLRKAVKPWLKMGSRPHHRWTASVDGYRSVLDTLSARAHEAISNALPLPTTYQDALAEQTYWLKRRAEMEDTLGDFGDDGLDLLARIRFDIVRKLVETDLVLSDLADIVHRFGLAEETEAEESEMIKAVYRDLKAYVEVGRR